MWLTPMNPLALIFFIEYLVFQRLYEFSDAVVGFCHVLGTDLRPFDSFARFVEV